MYRIIGGDQQEYGPVSAEEVRQWIAEGRLNAQSKTRAEAGAGWQTLGDFPEFAEALRTGSQPTPGPAPLPVPLPAGASASGEHDAALQRVSAPAMWLLVVGILDVAMTGFDLLSRLLLTNTAQVMQQLQALPPEFRAILEKLMGPAGAAYDLVGIVADVLIIIGALRMKALQGYGLAITASILAILPCLSPCCILSMPFGIWALIVLTRPEVKSQFT